MGREKIKLENLTDILKYDFWDKGGLPLRGLECFAGWSAEKFAAFMKYINSKTMNFDSNDDFLEKIANEADNSQRNCGPVIEEDIKKQ